MKSLLIKTIFLFCIISLQIDAKPILQASIHPKAKNAPHSSDQIEPGSLIQLTTKIKNIGDKPNKEGTCFIRFAFRPPLNSHKKSLLFKTENIKLPSIEPGKEITIKFATPHRWPTLFEYVREDWAMRDYEAIIAIDEENEVIGTRAVAFTAYYYPGHRREQPKKVPSL